MSIPRDIPKLYTPVWTDVMKTRPWRDLLKTSDSEVVAECFRLMLNEAGATVRQLHTTATFVQFPIKDVQRYVRRFIKPNFKVRKIQSRAEFDESRTTHSALTVNVQVDALVESVMRSDIYSSKAFDPIEEALKKLDGSAWRERPLQLYRHTKTPRKPAKALRDKDYYLASQGRDYELFLAWAKEGIIVRVSLFGPKAAPKYRRFPSDLKKIKDLTARRLFQ